MKTCQLGNFLEKMEKQCSSPLSSPGPEEDDKPEGPGVANLHRGRANGNALIKMFNEIFLKICIKLKQFRINRVKNKYA